MNKKTRRKIKAVIIKEFIKTKKKPWAIFKDIYENTLCQVEEFKRNPEMCMTVLHVKIVNLNKFSKCGFCWFNGKGKIENSEPFKVGDVGYINLVEVNGENFPSIFVKLFAECLGVELLEGPPLDIEIKLNLQKSSY